MKRITMAAAVIFSVVVGVMGQQPSQPAQPAQPVPTVEETVAWLKEKLTIDAGYYEEKGDTKTSRKLEDVTFDGCTLSYTDTLTAQINQQTVMKTIMKSKYSLADLDADAVKVELQGGQLMVKLFTSGREKKIKTDLAMALPGARPTYTPITDIEIYIPITNKELAERVGKAFRHAIVLCKAQKKKEPF